MSDLYLGQIVAFGGNFAIKGYAYCSAQILPIAQYSALFSILGTTYGGNGQTNFALPDLRGRSPLGQGQGPGLPLYDLGEVGGNLSATLTISNLPNIPHIIPCSSKGGQGSEPGTNIPAVTNNPTDLAVYNTYSPPTAADGFLAGGINGSNVPIETMSPYLAISWLIVMEGLYPPRN